MKLKVLIVRFSALGDLVLTTGPLYQLKMSHPSLEIDLLTSEIGDELYNNSIELENRFVLPKGSGLKAMIALYRQLPKYDVVIDWQGNFKSFALRFFQRASFYKIDKHSKERRQFVKDKEPKDFLQKHVVEKYFETLEQAFEMEEAELDELRPHMPCQPVAFDKEEFDFSRAVAIHPFASQENKVWPYFGELVKKLVEKNRPVVLLGNSDSLFSYEPHPNILDLRNKTGLKELASIIKSCQCLITTDSGPMHIGIAVNRPTYALFGPTTKEFGFYPRFSQSFVIENQELDCRPCHVHGGNQCPLEHHKCLKDISVEDVLDKMGINESS